MHFCGYELLMMIAGFGAIRHWIDTYRLWRQIRRERAIARKG